MPAGWGKWLNAGASNGSLADTETPQQTSAQQPPPQERYFGLENFGNTCYANAVLQSLFHCRPFRDRVFTSGNNNFAAVAELMDLHRQLEKLTVVEQPESDPGTPNVVVVSPSSPGTSSATTPATDRSSSPVTPKQLPPPLHLDLNFTGLSNSLNSPSAKSSAAPQTPLTPSRMFASQRSSAPTITGAPSPRSTTAKKIGKPTSSSASSKSRLQKTSTDSSLLTALKDLFVQAHNQSSKSKTPSVSPKDFIKKLREENELFRDPVHHDAHEFLNYLLNVVGDSLIQQQKQLDELSNQQTKLSSLASTPVNAVPPTLPDVARPVKPTWIHELFEGVLANETKCLTCNTVTERSEPFIDLSVDIPSDHTSITQCLKNFSAPERLDGRDKFMCDKCTSLQDAEKRMKIKKLPRILALHMKRFKYIETLGRHVKLNHRVSFPLQLRLPQSMTLPSTENPQALYELFAVIVHLGSGPSHGHYVCVVKSAGQWWLFDDQSVHPVEEANLSRLFGSGNLQPDTIVTTEARTEADAADGGSSSDSSGSDDLTGPSLISPSLRSNLAAGYGYMHGIPTSAHSEENTLQSRGTRTGQSWMPSGSAYILFYEAISASTNQ